MYNSAQNLLTQERGCRCPSGRTPQQSPSLPPSLRKPRRIRLRLALSNFPAINTLLHSLRTYAHPRAPFFILFCPFSRLLHPANVRKAAQAYASQNNLMPHLHDLRLPAPSAFRASALSPFNASTFQPLGETFWDENENLKNSILQHQHLAREILGRSSHFPEPPWPALRHAPARYDTTRATISRL